MRFARMKVLAVAALLFVVPALRANAQSGSDWPMYGHDLASSRFSPLSQINAGNVAKLSVAWSYPMRPGGAGPAGGAFSQVTPIVVNDSRGFYTSRVFGVFARHCRRTRLRHVPGEVESAGGAHQHRRSDDEPEHGGRD